MRHGGDETRFASQHLQADALRWCAFYADCRHEVLPVDEGWRVVLTFDLVVPGEATAKGPAPSAALLQALRARLLPEGVPSARPWAFLLTHEYSQRGLRWHLLKGEDRVHVSALRAAASELDLVAHLALAEIHESWTAIPGGGYGRHGDHDDHDGHPEPDELFDEDMTLNFWIDGQGRKLQRAALPVAPDDVESFAETDEDDLVNEEYEGYMGNYGETLDYWYRRAALVLQTPQGFQASRFVTEFDAALEDATALARSGSAEVLAARLQAGWPVLLRRARDGDARQRLHAYAVLAAALPDAEQALELCRGFDWTQLRAEDTATLAELARRRGAPWLRRLLDAWTQPERARRSWHWVEPDAAAWPQDLPGFAAAAQRAAWPPELLVHLQQACTAVWRAWNAGQADATPAARQRLLPLRLRQAAALAIAAHGLPASPRTEALACWTAEVLAQPALYPLLQLPELLHGLPAAVARGGALQPLHTAVVRALQAALAQPQRSTGDQRLEGIAWQCRCEHCASVIAWAESSAGAPLTLPLAEPLREHVKEQLAHAAAPLRCETLRQGRPYKLVIHKPADLHARRQKQHVQWAQALAALDQASSDDRRPLP